MKLRFSNILLCRLLAFQMNKWQMVGFTLGNVCGLFICLLAIQFYADIMPLYSGTDSVIRPGQLVLNKRVSLVRAMTNNTTPEFSDHDLEELSSQPFVDSLACFGSADFPVLCTVGSPEMGGEFSTYMFFESVPDGYLDIDLEEWQYEEGDKYVPIVLPKNYLNLYNFGFAKSQGLPNVTEGMLKQVIIRMRLGSGRHQMNALGRVAGFSRSINTILVPQAFLDYANRHLATHSNINPSRVIVRVNNPADERIDKYLADHNIEAETGDANVAKTSRMLHIMLAAVLVVGIIICTLSFYLLLMSIFILLQKNSYKIQTLLLLGYSARQIAQPFVVFTVLINLVSAALALLFTSYSRAMYLPEFDELAQSYSIAPMYPALIVALLLGATMTLLNIIAVRKHILNNGKE